jgi:hypothetical protein
MEITKDTLIDKGLQITEMFLLDHLSNGAYHPMFGTFLPRFTAKLIPSVYNNMMTTNGLPTWMIARSLQLGAEKIGETLFKEFGSDLIIRTGFLNNIPSTLLERGMNEVLHTVGSSIDISIAGFEDNLFPIAKDLQKMLNVASGLQMVFDTNSWLHIEFNPKELALNIIRNELPVFKTVDTALGIIEDGITSIRGVF